MNRRSGVILNVEWWKFNKGKKVSQHKIIKNNTNKHSTTFIENAKDWALGFHHSVSRVELMEELFTIPTICHHPRDCQASTTSETNDTIPWPLLSVFIHPEESFHKRWAEPRPLCSPYKHSPCHRHLTHCYVTCDVRGGLYEHDVCWTDIQQREGRQGIRLHLQEQQEFDNTCWSCRQEHWWITTTNLLVVEY